MTSISNRFFSKFFFAVFLLFSLAISGCGDKQEEQNNNNTDNTEESTSSLSDNVPTYFVAVEASYAPYAFRDENGLVVGFDKDLLEAIGEVEGFRVKLIDQPWKGIFDTLADGSRDIVGSGASLRDDRLEYMDASDPLYKTTEGFWVPGDSNFYTIEDLAGKTISTEKGTSVYKRLVGLDITPEENIKEYKTAYLAFKALLAGEVDAMYGGTTTNYALENLPEGAYPQGMRAIENEEHWGTVVYYVDKGRTDLVEKLNRGLATLKANGTYAEISKRWLGREDTFAKRSTENPMPLPNKSNTTNNENKTDDTKTTDEDNIKKYLVAVEPTYAPFAFRDGDGHVVGYDEDIIMAIGEAEGFEVQFIPQAWDGIFDTLEDGSRDIVASGISLTAARNEKMNASDPIFSDQYVAVFKKEAAFTNFNDLNGLKVSTQDNTSLLKDISGYMEDKPGSAIGYPTMYLAFQAMLAGEVDAVFGNSSVLNYYSQNLPEEYFDEELNSVPYTAKSEPVLIGMYVAKDRPELAARLNRGLEKIRQNGQYQAINQKWFGFDDSVGETTQKEGSAVSSADLLQPLTDDSPTYIVATISTFMPFIYKDEQGQTAGFDVDVLTAIGEKAGFRVKYISGPWDGIFDTVEDGSRDIISSAVVITPERQKLVDFSDPYIESGRMAVVKAPFKDAAFNDLQGKQFATQAGTSNVPILEDFLGGKENIKEVETQYLSIKEVLAGNVDAAFDDSRVMQYYVARDPNLYGILHPTYPGDLFGFGVKKGRDDLRAQINAGLQAIKEDGTYQQIYEKWFGKEESSEEEEKTSYKDLLQPLTDDSPTYIVATISTFMPFIYKDEQGQTAGFDVDVLTAIGEKAGFRVKYISGPWDGIFDTVEDGSRDIISSAVVITPERQKLVDFSDPYIESGRMAVVKAPFKDAAFDDLQGKQFATQAGTSNVPILEDFLGGKENIKEVETQYLSIKEVLAGNVDAAFDDSRVMQYYVARDPNLYGILHPTYPGDLFGFGVKKGRDDLRAQINAGLQAIKEDGTYNQIYEKWFGKEE